MMCNRTTNEFIWDLYEFILDIRFLLPSTLCVLQFRFDPSDDPPMKSIAGFDVISKKDRAVNSSYVVWYSFILFDDYVRSFQDGSNHVTFI